MDYGKLTGQIETREGENGKTVYCLRTHRRTLTETDLVNFVNLCGLHEPPFLDMEYVSEKMSPELTEKRMVPGPLLMSFGMGLFATYISNMVNTIGEKEGLGSFQGMVGVEMAIKNSAFVGDTLQVEVEAYVDRTTSSGMKLVDMKHNVLNQRNEAVIEFTEKIMFARKG